MDDMIRTNYEENCRLQALRDSLLPRLMSGEIDVSSVTI
jgi:type I restriction enzyme S subunit